MSVSLYRNFRPATFDEVVGQEHIVRTLVNQIKTGKISHAYIFTGTRGTGKTTTAKIFARAVNCLNPVNGSPCGKCRVCLSGVDGIDILELDGASNNGVDEIRALRDNSNFPPIDSKYKVYIIDEVHMLTINAFNALLKTLEEPPAHMIFILATTEIHKVPQTVLSRCMRFDFRLVPTETIAGRISHIFNKLNLKYETEAVNALAKLGEGSVRDALSYADIVLSYSNGKITYGDVTEALMVSPPDAFIPLATAILSGNVNAAIEESGKLLRNNSNINIVRRELCDFFRDLIFAVASGSAKGTGFTDEIYKAVKSVAERYEPKLMYRALDIFVKAENDMRYSSNPRVLLESAIIKAADGLNEIDESGLVIRIKNLENILSGAKISITGETKKADNISLEAPKNGIEPSRNASLAVERETYAAVKPPQEIKRAGAYDARAILGRVIKTFREKGLFQLYASVQNVYDASFDAGDLIVYFADEADYNAFCLDVNKKAAQGILDGIAEGLKLVPVLKKEKELNAAEEAERLKELFGLN
ncbi:MAG: DNA polymerase III subunit gamma/tau [Clostridiales bacterium]|jgi:DNA polymerase-3 subunit gamma/tau|nr:DNA polymerase III subunit gamma/tau [Clostridiales bacterium]